jgi:hypothetical protein
MTETPIKILPLASARGWTVEERPDGSLFVWFDYEEAIDRHFFKAMDALSEERKRRS